MKINRALLYTAMLGASLLVLALMFAPSIEALAGKSRGFSAISYLFFGPICHQDPARSFWLAGVQMPVCARCAGIYLGAFAGLIIFGLSRGISARTPVSRTMLIAAIFPIVVDGLVNALGIIETPGAVRAMTGVLAGAVVAGAMIPAINQIIDIILSEFGQGEGHAEP